jgi:hypothetical protein
MFKKNESYLQKSLFSYEDNLTKKQKKLWLSSIEHKFFKSVFQQIDETSFKVLYSDKKSRPNVPVNQLVGALILKHLYNWTYNELFTHLTFNILTRHSIGIESLEIDIFSEASLFNFQNRVINHYQTTGIDLIENVFKSLTKKQIEELNVDTSIQRGDSFLTGSNIIDYSKLQLLIEMLKRLFRVLDQSDKKLLEEEFAPYSKINSNQYIYRIDKENLPKEINQIAKLYHKTYVLLGKKYRSSEQYQLFKRLYKEQFKVTDKQIELVKIKSSSLMSPDDSEATYRRKGAITSKGYTTHINETANPDNEVNLITDVVVEPNNIDDAKILEKRLPKMIEETPDLKEYFADGLYGSPGIDEITTKNNITQYQTNVRGRKSSADLTIKNINGEIIVTCGGGQKIKASKTEGGKYWKAVFDYQDCEKCIIKQNCKLRTFGGKTKQKKKVKYFELSNIIAYQRFQNIQELPEKKRNIRANVEATIKEMKRGMKNGKVRIRTRIRISLHMIFTAIAVNLTRINKLDDCFLYIFRNCTLKIVNKLQKTLLLSKQTVLFSIQG